MNGKKDVSLNKLKEIRIKFSFKKQLENEVGKRLSRGYPVNSAIEVKIKAYLNSLILNS